LCSAWWCSASSFHVRRVLAARPDRFLAFLLAIGWVLLWWAMGDPERRLAGVAVILGVLGGLVLGVVAVGLYCVPANCAAGFDALVLVPAGALVGAVVGGGIGAALRGPHRQAR